MASPDDSDLLSLADWLDEIDQPRPRRWASPLDMACALDRTIVRTPALELVNRKLVELADRSGQGRLATFLSPQEGKSTLCSYWNPLWLLLDDPDRRILIISYSDDIARRWGADIKNALESFNGDDGTIDLGLRLRADSKAAGRWNIDGHRGGVVCAGIGGSITGRPGDCLRGDSRIITDRGYVAIKDLHEWIGPLPRVLSYNHEIGRAEWRRIVATRVIHDCPLVEVRTSAGRVIQCTPDHRIYTTAGYLPASDLRAGMGLLAADGRAGQVRALHGGVHEGQVGTLARDAGDPPVLLAAMPEGGVARGIDVRRVRQAVPAASLRGREGEAQGLRSVVLHQGVLARDGVAGVGGSGSGDAPRPLHQGAGAVDYRFHAADDHRTASLLRSGNGGTVRRSEPQARLRGLRQGPQGQGCDVPRLLDGSAGVDLRDVELRAVRVGVHEDAGRAREVAPVGAEERVLSGRMPSPVDEGAPVRPLRALQWPHEGRRTEAVLLTRVPNGRPGCTAGKEDKTMPAVREGFRVQQRAARVLRSSLRECSALEADGRRGELPVQGRYELRPVVPGDATADPGTRRVPLPGVRPGRPDGAHRAGRQLPVQVDPCRAPHRPQSAGQPTGQPDPDLPALPHGAPQVGYDTVSVVQELRGTRDAVYDLQVDGNSNFFAGEVLVHNCIIVDDPLKNLEEAQSAKYRDRGMRTWQGTLIPRMAPNTKVFWIQTLWHEQEPIQQILANEGDDWEVIRIPAICDSPDDPLGREIGEPMVSARGHRDWAKIRRDVGEYVFAALYQQRPAPAEGGLFKRLWWRYWSPAPSFGHGERIDLAGKIFDLRDCWRFMTGDLAASTRTSADWTVAAAWALTLDGDLVLLDRARARVGEAHHFDLFRPLAQRWRVDTAFVEATQHSMTLTAEATRSGLHVTPLRAESDKFSRALPASARASGGRIWLPAGASWLSEFVDEAAGFPNAAHDDQIDCLSYAVRVAVTKWAPPPPAPARVVEAPPMPDPFGGQPVTDFLNVPL